MILEELVSILEPFYEISIKCQQETIVTASLVVPAVVCLLTHLRDVKENVSYCTKLVNQLQSSIEIRFVAHVNIFCLERAANAFHLRCQMHTENASKCVPSETNEAFRCGCR